MVSKSLKSLKAISSLKIVFVPRRFPAGIISEKVIIGQSLEGNDIWAFKVSDNPNENEDEPELLLTGLIHAREPLSMMNIFYFVQLLAENYDSDPELNYLVNNREMWFIPVLNPDGYIYNESIEPSGGGMHRKNRKDTGWLTNSPEIAEAVSKECNCTVKH